jgi:hypothetical protein
MTAEEHVVALLEIIVGNKRAKLKGVLRRRLRGAEHTDDCRIGTATDGFRGPDYAPCSPSCVEIRRRATAALDFLVAHVATTPTQLELLEA